jgi:TonB family protein
MLGLTPEQLEAVLAHELAHIRRYDYLVNVLQMLAEALLFYHPAVWWTSARIRRERELCCDDEAVRACGDSFCYARALTALERIRTTTPSLALGGTDGPLAYRIKRLMGIVADENLPSKVPGLIALGLALACLGVSVNRVRAQAKPDAPGVRVDLGSSAVVHRAPVEYPDAAQIKNIKGTVSVEVHLDQGGSVSDARVLSGPEELRKPVLQSVLGWHFTPDAAGSTRVINVEFQAPSEEKVKTAAPPPPPPPPPPAPEGGRRPDTERTTEFLRAELDRTKANLEAQARVEVNQDTVQVREAEMRARVQLAELHAKLAAAEAAMRLEKVGPIPESLQGRTLRSIRLVDLSISPDDFFAQAQLPIREGDVLTRESAEAAAAAVKKFDEHLSLLWSVRPDGGVEMTIAAPVASVGGRGGRGATKGSGVSFPEGFQKANGTFGTVPVAVYQPAPQYTDEAKQAKWHGSVIVWAVVDKSGRVIEEKAMRPLGMGLDQKAVEAVSNWRFKPGTIDGKPATMPVSVEVKFQLQ